MTYSPTTSADQTRSFPSVLSLLSYLLAGTFFGVVLVKSEAASWYRIQEMFRFQSFHMYGLIGSAVLTGMLTTWLLRRFQARALTGQTIHVQSKSFQVEAKERLIRIPDDQLYAATPLTP